MLSEKKKGKSTDRQYSVFEIVNTTNGKRHYMITSRYTLENILSGIRTYVDSKTVKGGAKELAKDIKGVGEDYEKYFKVKEVGKGLSKDTAEKRRAELVTKASEVYNQEIEVQ